MKITNKSVNDYIASLKEEFPDLGVYEQKPWWLRIVFHAPLIKKLEWFNFTQAIGQSIYLSDNWKEYSPRAKLITLRHEREHLQQFLDYSFVGMALLYLFVFLPIFLAYFRAKFEREGLAAGMKARVLYYGTGLETEERCWKGYERAFLSSAYLWAFPFRKTVRKWFKHDWKIACKLVR